MLQGFEDAFTDAQARTISLALELLENNKKEADMIYIYIYQSDTQIFFNAFFAKDKKIYLLNDWFDDDQINDFFDCGVEDVDNIVEVCDTYDGKCPYEFKLIDRPDFYKALRVHDGLCAYGDSHKAYPASVGSFYPNGRSDSGKPFRRHGAWSLQRWSVSGVDSLYGLHCDKCYREQASQVQQRCF